MRHPLVSAAGRALAPVSPCSLPYRGPLLLLLLRDPSSVLAPRLLLPRSLTLDNLSVCCRALALPRSHNQRYLYVCIHVYACVYTYEVYGRRRESSFAACDTRAAHTTALIRHFGRDARTAAAATATDGLSLRRTASYRHAIVSRCVSSATSVARPISECMCLFYFRMLCVSCERVRMRACKAYNFYFSRFRRYDDCSQEIIFFLTRRLDRRDFLSGTCRSIRSQVDPGLLVAPANVMTR